MERINVYRDGRLAGWFDWHAKKDSWQQEDNGRDSGADLILTAGGKWVLFHWSKWTGDRQWYELITPENARLILLEREEFEDVEKYFGETLPDEEWLDDSKS